MEHGVLALSLYQPWASAIFAGLKLFETRGWSTTHRGLLLIHAGKRRVRWGDPTAAARMREALLDRGVDADHLPRGALLGSVRVVEVSPAPGVAAVWHFSERERLFGDFSTGRYAWQLSEQGPFPRPIPYRGRQKLFRVDPTALVGLRADSRWPDHRWLARLRRRSS